MGFECKTDAGEAHDPPQYATLTCKDGTLKSGDAADGEDTAAECVAKICPAMTEQTIGLSGMIKATLPETVSSDTPVEATCTKGLGPLSRTTNPKAMCVDGVWMGAGVTTRI